MGLSDNTVSVTGFGPRAWQWANRALPGGDAARLRVQSPGLYTLTLQMREDGLRLDRLLLTTDPAYVPVDFGPAESERLTAATRLERPLDHVINYDYDSLYRLTHADYSTGEQYAYEYDPVGNRLKQIIDGDTTAYLYDAANRLQSVNGVAYTFDANGNLLSTGAMTNTWDAANRLTQIVNPKSEIANLYNGVNDRVGQVVDGVTTHFALDVQGLPEVIYTSDGESYLHLPGVIMTESSTGEVRYLLSDGLGSVRQAVDETAQVVAYYEFDPYGVPVNNNGGDPYGYTGEWYGGYMHLLHLRARWYAPESGTFLSVDPVEGEPAYQYVRGNVVNRVDPSGLQGPPGLCPIVISDCDWLPGGLDEFLKPLARELNKNPYYQVFDAIETSKQTQDDDGFIFGFAGSGSIIWANTSANSLQELIKWDLAFNNICLPDTGDTYGLEIVYDFKHLERGIFYYEGDLLNIGTLANAGVTHYVGKTRGFVNFKDDVGVEAYGGYFVSGSLSIGAGIGPAGIGGTYIEAAPLNDDLSINRSGVFATYFGAGASLSASPSIAGGSGSGEVAVTQYYINWQGRHWRKKYIPPNANKENFWVRASAASMIQNEMTVLAAVDPLSRALLPQALIELWNFVYEDSSSYSILGN